MIKLKVNVNVDGRQLMSKAQKAKEKAQLVLDEQIIKDSNYFAPEDRGDLQNSALRHSKIGEGLIVWHTPYARRLYYNPQYNFSTDKNPQAGGLWYERAKAKNLAAWQKLAGEAYKRGFSD